MSNNIALVRTIAACYENGSTNIPLPKSLNRTPNADKWKAKYEDAEKKRKAILAQNERTSRDYLELQKKFKQIELQNLVIRNELSDKTDNLQKLRTVSKNLYKEYDTLKNQYELETGVMHKALTEASGWYRQNKELKRKSALILSGNVNVVDITDGESDEKELEGLRESIKELSAQNARLQTELSEAKLSEFEATEQVVNLTQEVSDLEEKCKNIEKEITDLKNSNEQMVRVSKLMSEELKEFQAAEEKRREEAVQLRHQADDARKERNVLAHQSTLLLQGIALDDDKMQLLQEIENLKRNLEDMTNKYERDIAQLQEKLEEREDDSQVEILEERLKLVESELQQALERAERLENQSAVPPPPPPPPLPPLLPLVPAPVIIPATKTPIVKPQPPETEIKLSMITNDLPKSPVVMRKLSAQQQPVIADVVNQIKGGKFTLRTTNKPQKKEREEPKAVSEMLQILGTLRRCPKPKSIMKTTIDMGDVQL